MKMLSVQTHFTFSCGSPDSNIQKQNELARIFIDAYAFIVSTVRVNYYIIWDQAVLLLHPVGEIILYTQFCRLYKHLRTKCFNSETEKFCWVAGCCSWEAALGYQFRLVDGIYDLKWRVLCQQSCFLKRKKNQIVEYMTIYRSCYLRHLHCAIFFQVRFTSLRFSSHLHQAKNLRNEEITCQIEVTFWTWRSAVWQQRRANRGGNCVPE